MTDAKRIRFLERPVQGASVILDTDTYNEIDDQFALSYLVRLNKFKILGFTAAPFFNDRSSSPEDGMVRSYEEIQKLQKLLGVNYPVYEGSRQYMTDETTPVDSPACDAIISAARAMPENEPLYVVAIGAITNVASAIVKAPDIIEKMTVVWLGGHAPFWPDTKEFNLWQDVAAARVIFGSGVPFVQLPCMGVVSAFAFSRYDLEHWLVGKNPLADYLAKNTCEYTELRSSCPTWTKTIWDVTAIAWLAGENFVQDSLVPSPIPTYDGHFATDPTRHLIRVAYHIDKDRLFCDLVEKLTGEIIRK